MPRERAVTSSSVLLRIHSSAARPCVSTIAATPSANPSARPDPPYPSARQRARPCRCPRSTGACPAHLSHAQPFHLASSSQPHAALTSPSRSSPLVLCERGGARPRRCPEEIPSKIAALSLPQTLPLLASLHALAMAKVPDIFLEPFACSSAAAIRGDDEHVRDRAGACERRRCFCRLPASASTSRAPCITSPTPYAVPR